MNRKKNLPQQAVVLKGLRGREGFTQGQLAKKLNISKSTISNIETGKREISIDEAKKLAKVLSTKPKMFEK
jgi:DNA-binding XRE family transcriptional regulator